MVVTLASSASTPEEALAVHGLGHLPSRLLAGSGLVNRTWSVGEPPRFALQNVNALFPPGTHARVAAVTDHLAARGLCTPRLVRAPGGAPVLPGPDGTSWRLLTWVEGTTFDRVPGPAHARSAATLVARFHAALSDVPCDLTPLRPWAHDTTLHMQHLQEAVDGCGGHRLAEDIRATGAEILAAWDRIRFPWPSLPMRPSHGDLKISNVRFDPKGREAVCLIDLDTLGRLPLPLELGDALRSWCNTGGEDARSVLFDRSIFEAAIEGYLSAAPVVEPAERQLLPAGISRIALELSARFCADALYETYFAWDPARAEGPGEHHLLRARGQLALALQIERRAGVLEAWIRTLA
ncbi:MAG: phosphotransferase [Deltaproteobacteria bacterium]|nr:phosphotransferase [Deltaproteobacteria bacterium]